MCWTEEKVAEDKKEEETTPAPETKETKEAQPEAEQTKAEAES